MELKVGEVKMKEKWISLVKCAYACWNEVYASLEYAYAYGY